MPNPGGVPPRVRPRGLPPRRRPRRPAGGRRWYGTAGELGRGGGLGRRRAAGPTLAPPRWRPRSRFRHGAGAPAQLLRECELGGGAMAQHAALAAAGYWLLSTGRAVDQARVQQVGQRQHALPCGGAALRARGGRPCVRSTTAARAGGLTACGAAGLSSWWPSARAVRSLHLTPLRFMSGIPVHNSK
jgi:hypothetical protein